MGYDNFLAAIGLWFIIAQIIGLVSLIFWILQLVRLFKRKDKTAAISILVAGLILILLAFLPLFWLFPLLWIPTLIALFLGRGSEEEELRERERERDDFWCGICNIKFGRDFLGGETIYEGKICRSCLGKKQRGEEITSPLRNQQPQSSNEFVYREPRYRRESSERKILLRELSRKQSKKNSHLTSFFINLMVLQWLLPLLIYVFFWIKVKEEMKVQALQNPGMELATEFPFIFVIKNSFKILTSETIEYGGHKIIISLTWKIGIILALSLPLIIWIYNLVRFFGAKGEVERLETEIKTIDR